MTKNLERAVTVYNVKRGRSTRNGNPSYLFATDVGEFQTESNAQCAYRVSNDFRINQDALNTPVTLILTPAGRVIDWKL